MEIKIKEPDVFLILELDKSYFELKKEDAEKLYELLKQHIYQKVGTAVINWNDDITVINCNN